MSDFGDYVCDHCGRGFPYIELLEKHVKKNHAGPRARGAKGGNTVAKSFKGHTSDAAAPILGAKCWKKGMAIEGTVLRSFETVNGSCYSIHLKTPITVIGENLNPPQKGKVELVDVSIGALKGFGMALQAAGLSRLEQNDFVSIMCEGVSPTDKGSPMVNFCIVVERQ